MKKAISIFCCSLAIFSLAASKAVHAQSKSTSPRIGILLLGAPPNPNLDSFIRGLGELHYVEGKNILFEYRFAQGKAERLPELATELVQQRVDAIFTAGTPALFAVKGATKTIPVVFFSTSDPVGIGAVASLAHPGGNITGSPVSPCSLRTYGPNDWSFSKKSFPSSQGWPWFGTKGIPA